MEQRISLVQKIDFFQELHSLYSCAFTLSSCLDNLYSDIGRKVKVYLKRGEALSRVLCRFNFEPEITFLLQTAELNGNIEKIIKIVLTHYQKKDELKRKLLKSLAYPCVTLTFSVLVLLCFLFVVIPKFNCIYEELNLKPDTGFKIPIQSLCFALLVLLFTVLANLVKIKEYLIHNLPLIKEGFLTYFYLMLAIIVGTKSNPEKFIEKIAPATLYPTALKQAAFYLKKGLPLSAVLKQVGLIEPKYYGLLKQAEYLNNVAQALENISKDLAENYFRRLEKIVMFAEPALVILIGLFIGFVSLVIISPIMQLTKNFV